MDDHSVTPKHVSEPLAAWIYQLALDANKPDPPELVALMEQSIISHRIARDLWACWCHQNNTVPSPTSFSDLEPRLQARFYAMAERAIQTIDPAVRLKAKDEAVQEIDDWMNGPGNMACDAPTPVEIAQEAISRYEALLSSIGLERGE